MNRPLFFVLAACVAFWLLVFWAVADAQGAQSNRTWSRLADCESGEWDRYGHPIEGTARWHIRDSYHQGGLQFAPSTWRAYKDRRMPANAGDAHVWDQVWVAERVLAAQGWRAWPTCSRKLGYRP